MNVLTRLLLFGRVFLRVFDLPQYAGLRSFQRQDTGQVGRNGQRFKRAFRQLGRQVRALGGADEQCRRYPGFRYRQTRGQRGRTGTAAVMPGQQAQAVHQRFLYGKTVGLQWPAVRRSAGSGRSGIACRFSALV